MDVAPQRAWENCNIHIDRLGSLSASNAVVAGHERSRGSSRQCPWRRRGSTAQHKEEKEKGKGASKVWKWFISVAGPNREEKHRPCTLAGEGRRKRWQKAASASITMTGGVSERVVVVAVA